MLSQPDCGWTDFQLEGTKQYSLSDLTDVPMEWLTQAIYGLTNRRPFCVTGFMEPDTLVCVVCDQHCHILYEYDHDRLLPEADLPHEYARVGMEQFCKMLHDDIAHHLEDWTAFDPLLSSSDSKSREYRARKAQLRKKLAILAHLLEERASFTARK